MISKSKSDHIKFWSDTANQLTWFKKWDTAFVQDNSSFHWFSGALTNISYNSLDKHIIEGKGEKVALVYQNERGNKVTYTYSQLLAEVKKVAAALRGIGIAKGDRVGIYMPVTPEAIISMLATTRIGAIHIVIFAGFGSEALHDRLSSVEAKILLTSNITFRKGKSLSLKNIVDETLALPGHGIKKVVMLNREKEKEQINDNYIDWITFIKNGSGFSDQYEIMESNDPAFILPTSGSTAKPKLPVHTHGGYQVGIYSMAKWMFDLKKDDIWWASSDIGWIVGHSYIVYAPLIVGCTTIAYEGAIDYPTPDAFWKIASSNKVSGIFTSPTALRSLMRYDISYTKKHDLASITKFFSAGEVLNPSVWEWIQKEVFEDRISVIDNMWQTETGAPLFGNPVGIGLSSIKPGSSGIALPGIDADVITMDGKKCGIREKGIVVLKKPFPSLISTLWNNPERYKKDYWEKIPGYYFTGDTGYVDEDGYYWFIGRSDEVIKIAAHRIGTIEVESAFLKHSAVAEVGVTGRPDPIRGEVISAFVVLRNGFESSEKLSAEILKTVRKNLGAFAVIGDINFVDMLPKTRSGKIMRRILKAVVLNKNPGDISTIEESGSIEDIKRVWEEFKSKIQS